MINNFLNRIWAWRPWRMFLCKIHGSGFLSEKMDERLLDYLYPDEAEVYFEEEK